MKAIVVGAGITGVAAALWLQRDGVDVTLVDRVSPGDPAQASYGNGGILARCAVVPVSVPGLLRKAPGMLLDPSSPLFLRWSYLPRLLPWLVPFLRNGSAERVEAIARALDPMTSDSVDQHLSLAKGTPAERFIATGDYMYLYPSKSDFEADGFGMNLRRALGYQLVERNRADLEARDPSLSPQYQFGAAFPDHGWITSPGDYVAALADVFTKAGGEIRVGGVVDVTDRITLKGGEEIEGDKIILSAGIWSRDLAKRLGHRINMEAERGYHLVLKKPSLMPPVPYMFADAKFVATPMEAGIRCAGIVELGGTRAPPSKAPLDILKTRIKTAYPTLKWESEETWMGFRPSTTDSLPVLGAFPRAEHVVAAFGAHHVGLTMGPRLGRMAADIAMGKTTNVDLTPYRADRFD